MFYNVQYMGLYRIITEIKYFISVIIGYHIHILNIVKHNEIPLRSIERLRCIV